MGEAADDSQREEKDHVLRHFPRHCHNMRGVVTVRPDRSHCRGDQTRSVVLPQPQPTPVDSSSDPPPSRSPSQRPRFVLLLLIQVVILDLLHPH